MKFDMSEYSLKKVNNLSSLASVFPGKILLVRSKCKPRLELTPPAKEPELKRCERLPSVDSETELLKSPMWYCTSDGDVGGFMTVSEHLIMFDPMSGYEQGELATCDTNVNVNHYHCVIDIADICSVNLLELPSVQFID